MIMVALQSFLTFSILNLLVAALTGPISMVTMLAFLMVISALMNYIKSWSHILLMLLTLEVLMLGNTLVLGTLVSTTLVSSETLFMFFTLAVCEASLSVAVLVCFSRYFGSDFLTSAYLS